MNKENKNKGIEWDPSMSKDSRVRKYIKDAIHIFKTAPAAMTGHVQVRCNGEVVFDDHNLVVDEGKGLVMDLLASLGATYTYVPSPFNAVVLTSNTAAEVASDTFAQGVFGGQDHISHEGVLHVGGPGGGQVTITHPEGALSFTVVGTLAQPYGNDPAHNHINSVCLCAGANTEYGGPGQAAYLPTGNERVFARANVGDLVKDPNKAYTFTWEVSIQ
jgi:hypothetical protein